MSHFERGARLLLKLLAVLFSVALVTAFFVELLGIWETVIIVVFIIVSYLLGKKLNELN